MANFDLLSADHVRPPRASQPPAEPPAPVKPAARGGSGIVGEYADEVIRNADGAVCWRGAPDAAAAPLTDLAAITGELARRGKRAVLSVELVAGGELLALVRIT